MLAAIRAVARRSPLTAPVITTRSFAEIVTIPSTSTPTAERSTPRTVKASQILRRRVPVKEDHGLYAFFRKKDNETLMGDARYDVVESPESMQKQTGRAWKASELRLKSFRDLHTLWYILLRERNLLATQKEEARRMGVSSPEMQVSSRKVYHVRKSMARMKAILNERRLAYEGALKIVEEEREHKQDEEVQNYLVGSWKERKYLQRRREYKARQSQKKLVATVPKSMNANNTKTNESQTEEQRSSVL